MKPFNTVLIIISFFGTIFLFNDFGKKMSLPANDDSMSASVFFTQSTTSDGLRSAFSANSSTTRKLNILLVPGHEPGFGGTTFRGILERDMNVDLAHYLASYLVEDTHFDVSITRDKDGWNPALENYFKNNDEEIRKFIRTQKMEMIRLINDGKIVKKSDNVSHNNAPEDVGVRLYGINKWANDNKKDIIIHIHFNDSAPRRANTPGEYNGFAIYAPDGQYSNSQASLEVAKYIFRRFSKMFPVSNLPEEDDGVVEDQDLIAVGNSNSVDAVSVLIEYGYIYEPQFRVPSVREMMLKELAFQTYRGLQDFFDGKVSVVDQHESTLLPYSGVEAVQKTSLPNISVLGFQAGLIEKGFYPPANYSRNDCPLTGFFGQCTQRAVTAFQQEFKIKGEEGIVGQKTRTQLRKLFEPSIIGAR